MKTYLVMVDKAYADARIYDVDEEGNTTEANEPFDTEILLKRVEARNSHEAKMSVSYGESLPVSYLKAYEIVPEVPQPEYEAVMSFDKFAALGDLIRTRDHIRDQTDYLLTYEQASELIQNSSWHAYSLVDENGVWMIKRLLIPNAIGYMLAKRHVELGDGVIYW